MKLRGLGQAAAIAAYCGGVGFFAFNVLRNADGPDTFLAPVGFLLLFSVSALICSLIVFYQPYLLFVANKKKDAAELVAFTAVWLFVILIVVGSAALVLH